MQSGDLATWVGSIGTTGSVVVAIGLAQFEWRRRRREELVFHAAKVSAWLELSAPPERAVILVVQNHSPSPVNDFQAVVIDVADTASEAVETWLPGIPPSGDRIEVELDIPSPQNEQHYQYELTYLFTDVNGRRWKHARGSGLKLLLKRSSAVDYSTLTSDRGKVRDMRRASNDRQVPALKRKRRR